MSGSVCKYDRVTTWLHAALALGALLQLGLTTRMVVLRSVKA